MDKLITLPLLQQYDELIKNKIETTVGNYLSLDGGTVNGTVTIDNQLIVNGNIQLVADASTASSRAFVTSSPSGQVVVQPTGRIMVYGNTTGKSGMGITIQSTPTSGTGSSLKVFDSGIMSAANDPNKVFASDGSLMTIDEYPEIKDRKNSSAMANVLVSTWNGSYTCAEIAGLIQNGYMRFLLKSAPYYEIGFSTTMSGTTGSFSRYMDCVKDYMTEAQRA